MNNKTNGIPTVDLDQKETVTLRELANIFRLEESATVERKLQEKRIAVT